MNFEHLKKAFKTEWLKIKGLGLLLMGLIFGILLPVLGLLVKIFKENARDYDGVSKTVGQFSIESFLSSYAGFFLIIFIIITATRICQTDHKNNGWTFLETQPLSKISIYTGKFLAVFVLSVISILVFIISSVIIGSITEIIFPQDNLSLNINFSWILHTFLRLVIMSLGVISLQIMLSVVIRGFVWPFMIGFLGFVINIVGNVRRETYDFVPYNNVETSLKFPNSDYLNSYFNYSEMLSLFWGIVFFIIGYLIYSNRGIKSAFFKNSSKIFKTIIGLAVIAGIYFWISKPVFPQKLEGKTIVEGTIISDKHPKFVTLLSNELRDEIAKIPVKNGKFYWETKDKIPFAEYSLDIDKRFTPLILSEGDHIIFEINSDKKHFEVNQKGTRKAEAQFMQSQDNGYSYFYEFTVREKKLTNDPKKFYEEAQEEWKENHQFLDKYRTKENIHFADDFYEFKKQQYALKMMNAVSDYQRMTSLSDKKFSPPSDFWNELQNIIKKPTNLLLTTKEYSDWKIKSFLASTPAKNADSMIFVKLSQMPKSTEKDQLLKNQLLKNFDLMRDENQRNKLFAQKSVEFSNPKFVSFVGKELQIINNQQKGKPFPALVFEDESGKKVSLNQFKGKYVVIDLWATWCGPCKETSPVFEYQAKNYRYQDNIVFLAASIDEDKNKWKLDIKNKKSDVTQWWIANSNALQMLGVNAIPRFIMIDPQGKIYNANMPRPNETNFEEILDIVGESKSFHFEM